VRTGRLLAHRMQALFAQDAFDFMKARAFLRRLHAYPVGLRQFFARHDLDGNARRLALALVFDARFVHRCDCVWEAASLAGASSSALTWFASCPAISSGDRRTPRSASCVTRNPS